MYQNVNVPTESEDTDELRRKRRQVEIKIERLETQLALHPLFSN